MNKLKANGFWVGVGTAGAIIAALFAIWVLPAWARQKSSRSEIAALAKTLSETFQDPPGVPGEPDIAQWEERRKEYAKDYQNIASFYKTSDKVLERWFDECLVKPPPYDQFTSLHKDKSIKLENSMRGHGIKVGLPVGEDETKDGLFGFNWVDLESLQLGMKPAPEQAVIVRDLQKRFNICDHIAKVCMTSGLQVERLCDVYFFRSLGGARGSGTGVGRPTGDSRIEYELISSDPTLSSTASGRPFEESLLPDNGDKPEAAAAEEGTPDGTPKQPPPKKYLGQTITFGLAVNLPYGDVPKFIAELISCEKQNSIIVNLAGGRIVARVQNDLVEERGPVQVPDNDPKKRDEIIRKAQLEFYQQNKPRAVQLQMICQVVDFEDASLSLKSQP